jgi:hypothetical protein
MIIATGPEPKTESDAVSVSELRLKRGEDQRINAGHPWVFSNEVDIARTPPSRPVRRCVWYPIAKNFWGTRMSIRIP